MHWNVGKYSDLILTLLILIPPPPPQKATLLKQCIDQFTSAETEIEKTRTTIANKKGFTRQLGKQVGRDLFTHRSNHIKDLCIPKGDLSFEIFPLYIFFVVEILVFF